MSRLLTLAMIALLAASSLVLVGSVSAQLVSKPLVPEFTLEMDDNGLTITVQNQPVIANDQIRTLIAYDYRYKWHESANWFPSDTVATQGKFIKQTGVTNVTIWCKSINAYYQSLGETSSHQLDYQIRAINGYLNSSIMYSSSIGGVDPNSQPIVIVSASDWSDTQTISLSGNGMATPLPTASSPAASTSAPFLIQTPTIMPTKSDNKFNTYQPSWLEVVAVAALGLVAVLLVVVVVLGRKLRRLERKVAS